MDVVICEIDVFHSQAQTFHQTHAGGMKETGHQLRGAGDGGENALDFLFAHDGGDASWPFSSHQLVNPAQFLVQHLTVKERQGIQRLILGRGRNFAPDREVRQKRLHLRRAHLSWMPLSMKKMNRLIHPTYASSV
jgi:hypothetical protein